MTIKQVSEKYHISQDTLRYYEKVKMIPPVRRTSSGIRDYTPEDIAWLEFALCMRKAGLSVKSVTEYLSLFMQGEETVSERLALLKHQMDILQKQKKQLEITMQHLSYKIDAYEEALQTGELKWETGRKPPQIFPCE